MIIRYGDRDKWFAHNYKKRYCFMKTSAIAIANYFVDLSKKEGKEIRLLGLIKRVYITHGFTLALYDRSALNPRFDVVEAWKLGPVIPSVYHSFKHFKTDPITEESVVFTDYNKFEFPELKDKEVKHVANSVWKRYIDYSDFEMIKLLHREGTPWGMCYVEGENREIPDLYTRVFYKKLLDYENE
jgi:uncharacterized phage-associated protein